MTNDKKLKFITDKCIEANQSILDLKFGCEVKYKGVDIFTVIHQGKTLFCLQDYDVYENFEEWLVQVPKEDVEIIGRPIILPDILMALDNRKHYRFSKTMDESNELIWDYWNLKETFENQSQPTKDYVYELLL